MDITDSFKIPDYSGCGVYAIINILDFKAYVGSSGNLKRRAYRHFRDLKEGKHYIDELQKDSCKGLRFVILDKYDDIDKGKLRIAEYVFMLKMLDQNFDLYNINPFKGYNGPPVKTTPRKKCVNQDLVILILSRPEPPMSSTRRASRRRAGSLDRAAMACYNGRPRGCAYNLCPDFAAPSPAPVQQASGVLSRPAESGAKQDR